MKYGSLYNMLLSQKEPATPKVGDGATKLGWSDRRAYTVVEVLSEKKVVIQRDKATRTDGLGMSDAQSYSYERDPSGSKETVTLSKGGQWKAGASVVGMGYRSEYYDFSF